MTYPCVSIGTFPILPGFACASQGNGFQAKPNNKLSSVTANMRYCIPALTLRNTQLAVAYNAKLEPGTGGFSYLAVARQGQNINVTDLIYMPSNADSVGGQYSGVADYRIRQSTKTEIYTMIQNSNGKNVHQTKTFVNYDTSIFHVRNSAIPAHWLRDPGYC